MKTCDTKKLWVHLPKVLFGLAGLLTVSVFIYGNQIKKINYQFSDVKKFYEKFVQANDREAESGDKAKLAVNNDVSLSTSQTLAVDWVSVYRDTPYQGPDSYIDFAIRQRKLRALNHIKPLKPEYGMVIYDVADYAYSFDANKTKCILDSGKPTLFVAIASVTGNFEKRRAIRETWLEQLLKTEWSHFNIAGAAFILGEPEDHYEQTMVSIEAQDHNDIIQVNVPDRFFDLNKKVVGLFNWLHKNCNEVDYLLKVDDDVYVNPFNIDKLLAMKKPLEPTMIGTSIGNPPSRGKTTMKF